MREKRLIILHFVYHNIDTVGSPVECVHNHLHGFFKNDKSLFYKEIRFHFLDIQSKQFQIDDMLALANVLMM
jgi:hypothetical protein